MTLEKDKLYLEHILESISDIEKFVRGIVKNELEKNKEKLNATIRSIEIIGEASKNLSEEFRAIHKEINWKNIIGTRDILIRKYFGVDIDEIWEIISQDLPELKMQISGIK